MIERFEHPTLAGLSKQELLEGMSKDAIVNHILTLGDKATEIEKDMNLAADVLAGAHGVSVEDVLAEREKKNGEQI